MKLQKRNTIGATIILLLIVCLAVTIIHFYLYADDSKAELRNNEVGTIINSKDYSKVSDELNPYNRAAVERELARILRVLIFNKNIAEDAYTDDIEDKESEIIAEDYYVFKEDINDMSPRQIEQLIILAVNSDIFNEIQLDIVDCSDNGCMLKYSSQCNDCFSRATKRLHYLMPYRREGIIHYANGEEENEGIVYFLRPGQKIPMNEEM